MGDIIAPYYIQCFTIYKEVKTLKKLFTAFTFFVICMAIMLLTGCQQPVIKVTKKYYTTTTTTADIPKDAKVYKVYPEPTAQQNVSVADLNRLLSAPIQKMLITQQGTTAQTDLANGIIYYDNSFAADGIYHELDLSYIVGDRPSQVYLLIRFVDGCEDEPATLYFRPSPTNSTVFGSNINMVGLSFTNTTTNVTLMPVLTNEHGVLQWYNGYAFPFINAGVYKAKKYEIYAVYYSNGFVVNTAQ